MRDVAGTQAVTCRDGVEATMDSRQAYLAAKYMSGPKADAILAKSSKSKKKKTGSTKPSTSSAFVLQDNDTPWSSAPDSRGDGDNEQSMSLADAVVASDRSFKKRRGDGGGGWETIRAPTPPPPDEQPVVVQDEGPRVIGGILGGAELTRLRGETEAAPVADQMDTVYRDASGRKIDTKAEKAAAARRKRLQEEKEAQKMEWGKGLVQRDEAERNRQELEREKTRDIARCVDIVHITNSKHFISS